MFTDVEGSTARWERYGNRFGEALLVHDRLIREAIARYGGYEVKTAGDKFMVTFSRIEDAAGCAVDIQVALAAANADQSLLMDVEGVAVRIGIHIGEPVYRNNDYFGPPVNRADRICDAGHGGLILFSQEAARFAAESLPADFKMEDCGLHRLKDLGQPERLFVLHHPRIADRSFTKLRTLEALPHNFPAQVTSFVGRQREMEALTDLLHNKHGRLITLTGPGGTGKTRLAIQAAANLLQDYSGGVWLVDLASVRDVEAVPAAVALALSLPLAPDTDPRSQVIAFLRPRRSLLVLDNFEQVANAAPRISDLLRECPNLACLVTSRELLHLAGEREFIVEPLSTPTTGGGEQPWTQYESVQLFLERCQAMRPDFALTEETGPIVGEICRWLDGIPLAIELAAARVRGMTPHQVLQRLTRRFDLLSSGQRDLPERQRTLRKAIDWSYELLTEDERSLFAELAVFRGGFQIEAAEEICVTPDAFDLVFSLRDKSLLKTDEVHGQVRFSMLETLREYALERMMQAGALPQLYDQHADYYLRLAQQWASKLDGTDSDVSEAMDIFTIEIENMRAGMDWAAQQDEVSRTVEFGGALARFLLARGLYDECDTRLTLAEDSARRSGDTRTVAVLLNQRGRVAWRRSDQEGARRLYQESYDISRKLDDRARMVVPVLMLGNIAWGRSEYRKARELWEEALALTSETNQPRYDGVLRCDLGILACLQGDYEAAERYFEEALVIQRRQNDEMGIACTLTNSTEVFRRRKEYERGLARLEESRRIFMSVGDRKNLADTNIQIGAMLLESGRLPEAQPHAEEGLRIAQEMGDRRCEMYALDVLARIAAGWGDAERARPLFRHSIAIAREVGDARQIADVIQHYGLMLRDQGEVYEAADALSVARGEYRRLELHPDADETAALLTSLQAESGTSPPTLPLDEFLDKL